MRLRRSLAFIAPAAFAAPVSCQLWLLLLLVSTSLVSPLAAKTPPASTLDPGYLPALAAADHFLQAWQTGDAETGMALLTSHAREKVTTDVLDEFFSNSSLSPAAYEIERGKLLKRGRYEFPVVFFSAESKNTRAHRRFSSVVIVDTGHNDWAVDKLP
jgi:hypothetical protein